MNIAVVSYSFTGNNERFAASLAEELSAEYIRVQPRKQVTYGSITLDLLLGRSPAVEPAPASLSRFDLLVFVAPVWMGQVAFPLRAYLAALKRQPKAYGFLSICIGGDNEISKLAGELVKRTGTAPSLLVNLPIRELLPAEPAPTRDDISTYRLTEPDCAQATALALEQIRCAIPLAFQVR